MAAGSPLSTELIPWWSPAPDLTSKFEAGAKMLADRGLEGNVLEKLTMTYGPTLSESDKTMYGPIAMGLLTTANVELGQWLRRGMTSEKEVEEKELEKQEIGEKRGKGSSKKVKIDLAPIRADLLGNILRAAAIGFVVVSSQAPAVSGYDQMCLMNATDRYMSFCRALSCIGSPLQATRFFRIQSLPFWTVKML